MRAWLNGKETQNLAVAYPGDTIRLKHEGPGRQAFEEPARIIGALRGYLYFRDSCWNFGRQGPVQRGFYPYADARPNLCDPGPASETCAKDPSTHRPRWPSCGSVITAHCLIKGRTPKSEHSSPKLPSTDCTVT